MADHPESVSVSPLLFRIQRDRRQTNALPSGSEERRGMHSSTAARDKSCGAADTPSAVSWPNLADDGTRH
jgi:hypothetical protein